MRTLALVLLLVAAQSASAAPGQGLMWNRTGLPAVFPLQIRTLPGRDLFLILRDAETDEDALAAYATGGEFFRALVPPGTFTLHVALGNDWEGEEQLFGPETETYTYPDPLEFAVTGLDRKSGHLIDLHRIGPDVEARAIGLCQRFAYDAPAATRPQADRSPDPAADDWDSQRFSLYDDGDRRRSPFRDPRREALLDRRNLHVFPRPDTSPSEPFALPDGRGAPGVVERFCG